MGNGLEAVRERLKRLSRENIELRDHVLLRLSQRCVRIDELVDNLLNPRNLYKAEKKIVTTLMRRNTSFTSS